MPPEGGKLHLEWIKKAEEDELSIRAILKGGGAPSTGCFLSQQMAEKYLKCLLSFHRKPYPKTHDLLDLASLLMLHEPSFSRIRKDLNLLNRYYIETRYPGDYPEFTPQECREAFESALRVKEFVLERIAS